MLNIGIIGAGLSGLSAGIHLLLQGHRVTIYEKNARPGGRANLIDEKGFRIDMGPTLVLMPDVLRSVFERAGRRLEDYLTLRRLTPGYRIGFGDGRMFDMTDDMNVMVRQVKSFRPDKEEAFFDYVKDAQDKFVYSKNVFIERNFESIWDMVNLPSLKSFFKIKPFGNAYDHVYRYFKDDYLATAFSCQCLYLGQSPRKTPALYNLLAYLEFTYGIWYPEGGMHQIPLALARLFNELGGSLNLNAPAASVAVEDGTARGIRLADGTLELYDVVISNRDLPASYEEFVDAKNRRHTTDERIKKWHYGCSAVMFYLGLSKKCDALLHHNIMLSRDTRRSLDQIFNRCVVPEEPLLYVCAPTRTDETLAPPGREIVYVLALAPNLEGGVDWERQIPDFRRRVFARLGEAGVDTGAGNIELEKIFTPRDFRVTYGNYHGNAFGLAPDFFQSACFRPRNKSRDVKRFYHTGASTHPGGGIPMVLTSGRLVAEQIAKDCRSNGGRA